MRLQIILPLTQDASLLVLLVLRIRKPPGEITIGVLDGVHLVGLQLNKVILTLSSCGHVDGTEEPFPPMSEEGCSEMMHLMFLHLTGGRVPPHDLLPGVPGDIKKDDVLRGDARGL